MFKSVILDYGWSVKAIGFVRKSSIIFLHCMFIWVFLSKWNLKSSITFNVLFLSLPTRLVFNFTRKNRTRDTTVKCTLAAVKISSGQNQLMKRVLHLKSLCCFDELKMNTPLVFQYEIYVRSKKHSGHNLRSTWSRFFWPTRFTYSEFTELYIRTPVSANNP